MPQRCKLDEVRAAKLIGLLRVGNYIRSACASAGISKTSFYSWRNIGVQEREARQNPRYKAKVELDPFVSFVDEVEKAEAQFECHAIDNIKRAAGKNWTAYAWLLERKFPQRWGRRDRADVPAEEVPQITLQDIISVLDTRKLSKDEKIQLVALLRKCGDTQKRRATDQEKP